MHQYRRFSAPPALLGATLMAALAPASAQVAPAALAECAAIAADNDRLACFDRLSGRPARPAVAPRPPSD